MIYVARLYRNAESGAEEWMILGPDGVMVQSGIPSDGDVEAILTEWNVERRI